MVYVPACKPFMVYAPPDPVVAVPEVAGVPPPYVTLIPTTPGSPVSKDPLPLRSL